MKRVWLQFFYLLYCVEAGIFLILAPWSLIWSTSYFAQIPALREVLLSGYVRGAVTSLGLLHLVVAGRDFVTFCRSVRDA